MRSSSQAKPRLACEITSQNVIAARAKSDGSALEVHTVRKLAVGAVKPSLNPGNITDIPALSQSIAGALSTVGGRKRDLIAVIPDAAVRVLLMDFDSLPEKVAEAEPIVRFRRTRSACWQPSRRKKCATNTSRHSAVQASNPAI
jgi:type IV pilus assembly protein PilM